MVLRISLRVSLALAICLLVATAALPQTRTRRSTPQKRRTQSQPQVQKDPSLTPTSEPAPIEEVREAETIKIDTNLVVVPVIATTVEGNYVPDLRQEEFNVSENDERQEVAFFAAVSAPFHVVLLLDTSASTKDKLSSIQRAAVAFVEQLSNADRVKIISFDNQVRELSDFTSDRAELRNAIYKATSGEGTKLYDAFELALSVSRTVQGRKAIVLFSDGVDWHSDQATFDYSLHHLDQEGVIVYPIRFETRAESERLAREASQDSTLPTLANIRKTPPAGTAAPTFPSDDPPASGQQPKSGPLGLPTAAEILRRRRQRDRDVDRNPSPDQLPPPGGEDPVRREPIDPSIGDTRRPDAEDSARGGPIVPSGRGTRRPEDSIGVMMDELYQKADSYLTQLANRSGGRLLRADTVNSLPDAFAKIAAELRIQYAIGYYPTNKARDGQYRKIKLVSTRKGVVVRARPGYRAPRGG